MKIAQGDQVAPQPAVRHRGGGLQARLILEGTPGAADNFQLSLSVTGSDFISPRHRHNFEQYRVVLDGDFDFGRDGVMPCGAVGYFPEGVYYGPQSSGPHTLAAVLQFGGVSLNGYLAADDVWAGMQALQEVGSFEKGVFRRHEGVPGRKNQDAFEAIWEHVNGRPLTYTTPPTKAPVVMNPDDFAWTALPGAVAVSEKRLGRFARNDTGARLLLLEAGARMEATGRGLFLVLSDGAGTIAGEPMRRLSALSLDAGETALLTASAPTRILHYELPVLAPTQQALHAAE